MSGIAGIYHLKEQLIEREQLGRMVDTLAHRGSDGADVWCKDSIGLGNRLLWTTRESILEKLPLVNSTGNLVLTADARIDNREELISALDFYNLPAEKITDSQLILAAYEKWGEECPAKLIGDFAFAIWDKRKQELFCARDYMGVRPFYYYYHPGKIFAFASEIKALFSLPQVPRKVNEAKVGIFLCQLSGFAAYKTDTFYQDIFRLPAANWMKLSKRGLEFKSFWDLHGEAMKIQSQLKTEEDYVSAFRSRFTEAIACRLRSAYPIVSTLSGGLDSSSVSCVARNLLREQNQQAELQTIYGDCGVPSTDEKSYVNAVLAQGGFKHHIAKVTGAISSAETVTPSLDQPVQMPTPAILLATLQSVNNMGARVLLTGHDGDTIVSHGRDYLEEVESDNWQKLQELYLTCLKQGYSPLNPSIMGNFESLLPQSCEAEEAVQVASKTIKTFSDISLQDLVSQNLIKSSSEKLYRKNKIRERMASRNWQDKNSTISHDFAQRIDLEQLIKSEIDYQFAYLPSEYLNHYRGITSDNMQIGSEQIDAMSSALGIEPRHPFLDKRVIELCLAVPAKIKYESGLGRGVMRRAMQSILPEEVRERPDKVDFYGFIMQEVECDEMNLMEKWLFDKQLDLTHHVNVDGLKETKQNFFNSKNTWENRRRKARIFNCTTYLAMWLSESRDFH